MTTYNEYLSDKEINSFDVDFDGSNLDASIDDRAFEDTYYTSDKYDMDLSGNTTYTINNNSKNYDTLITTSDGDLIDASEVDSSLARQIFDFLNGNTKKLPLYVEIDNLLYNSGDLISIGYGLTINKDLEISITTKIENSKRIRVDVISKDGYHAYTRLPGATFFTGDPINVSVNPIYSGSRIIVLMAYLADYAKTKNNVSRETSSR